MNRIGLEKQLAMSVACIVMAVVLSMFILSCAKATPTVAPAPPSTSPAPKPAVPSPSTAAPTAAPSPSPTPVKAITLKLTSAHTPPPLATSAVVEWWAKEVEKRTEGRVKFEIYWGGSLTTAKELLQGVATRQADIGHMSYTYSPSEVSLLGYTYAVPFNTVAEETMVKIAVEMLDTIPGLVDQLGKYNQHFLGYVQVNADYNILSKVPLKTLADFKAVKLAAAGDYLPKVVAVSGAVPLVMNLAAMYEGLQLGTIQGATLPVDMLYSSKMYEVSKYYIGVGLGNTFSAFLTINKDSWKALPPDIQKIMRTTAEEASLQLAARVAVEGKAAVDNLRKAGIEIITLPDAERTKWINATPDFAREWAQANDAKGLPGTQVMKAFLSACDKYGVKLIRKWMTS